MGGGLEGINQDNRNDDTIINTWKYPLSLEGAEKLAYVRSVASDNYGSEFNNDIVAEAEKSDDGSVEPYSPSGILG